MAFKLNKVDWMGFLTKYMLNYATTKNTYFKKNLNKQSQKKMTMIFDFNKVFSIVDLSQQVSCLSHDVV